MIVSREEFMESISYLEIDTTELIEFAHSSIANLPSNYFRKKIKPEIFAVHDASRNLLAIQPYNQCSIEYIKNAEEFHVLPLKELLQPHLH